MLAAPKKVMVLLYLDFLRPLGKEDAALVRQVVTSSTNSLFGIDPGSTSISFTPTAESSKHGHFASTRARVTFFILGSNENSIELRKRLLELANDNVANQLRNYGIEFTMARSYGVCRVSGYPVSQSRLCCPDFPGVRYGRADQTLVFRAESIAT